MENAESFIFDNWLIITISFISGFIASVFANIITEKIPPFISIYNKRKIEIIKNLKYSLFWSSIDNRTYLDTIKVVKKGGQIIISNTNEVHYKWKAEFALINNQLIGNWEQENKNGHKSKGAAYIRLTLEAIKIGLWIGDAEGSTITYGFWLFGINEREMIKKSKKLISKGFSTMNLMTE